MAKASHSLPTAETASNPAITAAADEIHALINGKPRSPTKDELAAIITKATLLATEVNVPKLRAEWNLLASEMMAVDMKYHALVDAEGGLTDAAANMEDGPMAEAMERSDDCARRIVKQPVRSHADLMLLAEAAYWCLYTEPSGLWAPEAEAQLAGHPPHVISGIVEEAVLALLRGVRDVGMRGERRLSSQPTAELARWDALVREYVAHISQEVKNPAGLARAITMPASGRKQNGSGPGHAPHGPTSSCAQPSPFIATRQPT